MVSFLALWQIILTFGSTRYFSSNATFSTVDVVPEDSNSNVGV